MSQCRDEKEIREEIRYLRTEFMKTIEYIKGRMLTFLYYSFTLQVGIFALSNKYDSTLDNIILALVSLIVAMLTMCYLLRYQSDLQYYRYRSDVFLDKEFSDKAKAGLDIPYEELENTDDIIKRYFKFFINEPFIQLYLILTWGICLTTFIFLITPVFLYNQDISTIEAIIVIVLQFKLIICLSYFLIKRIHNETRLKLEKHKHYVKLFNDPFKNTERAKITEHIKKFKRD